jgi:integrase
MGATAIGRSTSQGHGGRRSANCMSTSDKGRHREAGMANARTAMVLALNTTMRACEIKSLRWYDVDFLASTVTIRKSKTEAGQRMIPLTDDALSAIKALYSRASAIGGIHPDHHVFPACENGYIDPTMPQKSWRSAWKSLRKAAGIPGLRFHDLRHHAIT